MESVSQEVKIFLHEFALKNNCVKESYWGHTFEGNGKISSLDIPDSIASNIQTHIAALKKFNEVKTKYLELNLHLWKKTLDEFKNIYLELENITVPPKVHILFNHVEEYISKFGIDQKGLGFYSEQTGESVHQKFEQTFSKYKIENTNAENYGLRLRKVVVEFSSLHI